MTTCITVDIITFRGVVVKVMTIVCDDNTTSPLLQVVAPLMGWVRNYHGYSLTAGMVRPGALRTAVPLT